jgi:predicted dehydrogenase
MKKKENKRTSGFSRRNFIKASAAVGMAAILPGKERLFAAGSDKMRVGVIGCGGRGTGAAIDCLNSADGIEIVAIGDLFKDSIDSSLEKLREKHYDKVKVTKDTCFVGFSAYKKVIACDVNLIIMAPPPHFRPMHFKAAIEAGKHVFMEKPVGVDPAGIRSVIEASELAQEKGLAVVAGTQRRHQAHYVEIMKRIHNGDIGRIVAGQCYWNMEGLWVKPRQADWSDMEWQCRNWLYFTWLSGDHIVEQHVHNLDVINWAIGSHPVKAMGMGGRQVRTGSEYGNIFDHFAVEYEYDNDVRVLSMCRQTDGCSINVSERVVGTKALLRGQSPTNCLKENRRIHTSRSIRI